MCQNCPSKHECLNPANDPVPCPTCISPTIYATDLDIISTSIIKEVGYIAYKNGYIDAYDAIAWVALLLFFFFVLIFFL
jgi:hypothetical protein